MEFLHNLNGFEAYAVICLLLFIEESGIPLPFIPGDFILLTAGYLAAAHHEWLVAFLPAGFASAVLGATVCYGICRRVGAAAILRHGWRIRLTPRRLERAEKWLSQYGVRAIMIARILPGARINSSIAAGCLRLPFRTFLLGVLPSAAVWLTGFTLLGFVLGDNVGIALPWFDRGVLLLVCVSVPVALIVWRRRVVQRRRRETALPA